MAKVYIPASWRDLSGGLLIAEVEAANLRQVIAALDSRFPGIAERACERGEIASGLAVSIDGAITSRGLLSPVTTTSEVHFLPAIGGG
jgi:molybdopterin synthase sulfur carrier subunit